MMSNQKNLWIAASDGDIDRVNYLIENEGHHINDRDSNGYSIIHAAASYNHVALLRWAIQLGGNVNIRDNDNDTPLHVVEDNVPAAKLLLDHGADLKAMNDDGQTPLDIAKEEEHERVARLFEVWSGVHAVVDDVVSSPDDTSVLKIEEEDEGLVTTLREIAFVEGVELPEDLPNLNVVLKTCVDKSLDEVDEENGCCIR